MVLTKGNIIVENIKLGDIIYEFEMGIGIKSEVISLPSKDNEGIWFWECKNLTNQKIIKYVVNEKYPHYGPNIYDYEAYKVKHWI